MKRITPAISDGRSVLRYPTFPSAYTTSHRRFSRRYSEPPRLAGVAERFVEPDSALSGYGWYDVIPKVGEVEVFAVSGNSEKQIENSERGETLEVDAIRLTLRSDSDEEVLSLQADIALLGEEIWAGEDPDIVITRDCGISIDDLVDLLMASYFEPSDDSDSDSYDTQREVWNDGFTSLAMRLLLPVEEEMKRAIEDLLRRHLAFVLQPGYGAEILLCHGEYPKVVINEIGMCRMRIEKGPLRVYRGQQAQRGFRSDGALSRRLGTAPALTDSVKAGGDGANVII